MDYKKLIKIIVAEYPGSIFVDEGQFVVTTEWLVGPFAGVGFSDKNLTHALEKMCAYLSNNIGYNDTVGKIVNLSGWPNLEKVEQYLSKD